MSLCILPSKPIHQFAALTSAGICLIAINAMGIAKQHGYIIDYINLYEKNIVYCKGCRACMELQNCVVKDDIQEISGLLKECSIVILAAPVYWANVPAIVKNMFDHFLGVMMEVGMTKRLSEMTLEELWQLFPVFLTRHNDKWNIWYNEEYEILCSILPGIKARISHIGSTAIENIWAKPIIDILIEIPLDNDIRKVKGLIVQNGYICMAENTKNISFNKGYTENGFAEKVFHLHLRYWGDNDELYFRDYMNDNPMIARDYEKLKLSLWKIYEHNRDGYTNAKHNFISRYTKKAKQIYKDRYL